MEAYNNGRNCGRPYQLKHFILGRSRLHNEGIIPLSAAFKKIGTLEEIRVFYNAITSAGIVALAHAVQRNPNLRVRTDEVSVCLSVCLFICLSLYLRLCVCQTSLIRQHPFLLSNFPEPCCTLIVVLTCNLPLQILDISDNAAKRQGAAALGEALKHCPRLEVLLMESCHLRDAGMDALLPGLAGAPILRLYCSADERSQGGFFVSAVRAAALLIDLVHFHELCSYRPAAIASPGAGKGLLREVDLCYNELTPPMARKLAAALQPLSSIASVRLNGNEFGESGLEALQVFGE
jgi:hypothetical protein